MSTDESTIPFPINQLKAETLRSIAKDLGVIAGGKKEELLERMRASSASGWATPIKRKAEMDTTKTPLSSKKRGKTPQSAPRLTRSAKTPSSPSRTRARPASKPSPVKRPKKNRNEGKSRVNDDSELAPRVFDDYLVSGKTNVFITADDLLELVDKVPTSTALPLWKSTSAFSQRDRALEERVHHWLIPANEEGKVQNVAAFGEAYKDILENERKLKAAKLDEKEAEKSEEVDKTKKTWYEISVSRNLEKGALAVKLIKATIDGIGVVPLKDVDEEDGNFWLSAPSRTSQDDSEELDHVVKQSF